MVKRTGRAGPFYRPQGETTVGPTHQIRRGVETAETGVKTRKGEHLIRFGEFKE